MRKQRFSLCSSSRSSYRPRPPRSSAAPPRPAHRRPRCPTLIRPHPQTTIPPLLVLALFLQAAPAAAQRRAAATSRTEAAVNNSNATSRALQKFLDDEWEWTMRENPTFASTLGDRRYNDRWEDASLENIARQHQHEIDALKRLESIRRA